MRMVAPKQWDLRAEVSTRTGPFRTKQPIRQLHAAGRFRADDDETDGVLLFPRTGFALRVHGLLTPSHKISRESIPGATLDAVARITVSSGRDMTHSRPFEMFRDWYGEACRSAIATPAAIGPASSRAAGVRPSCSGGRPPTCRFVRRKHSIIMLYLRRTKEPTT